MTPGLVKLLSAAALAALTAAPSVADAHRVRARAHVHGGFSVHGGVSLAVGAPVVVAPAPVYSYPPDYYYAPPPPPPAPAPPPAQPYYYPPPAPVVTAPVEPRRPVLGLGVLFSSIDVEDGALEGAGAGVIGRIRFAPRWQLELQISQDHFRDNPRIDTRFGGAVLYELGQLGGFSPYLLLGLGANVISPLGEIEDDEDVRAEDLPHQGYVEAGVGASFMIGDHFELSGDLRLQSRKLAEDEDGHTRSFPGQGVTMPDGQDEETAAEGRVNLIYWF